MRACLFSHPVSGAAGRRHVGRVQRAVHHARASASSAVSCCKRTCSSLTSSVGSSWCVSRAICASTHDAPAASSRPASHAASASRSVASGVHCLARRRLGAVGGRGQRREQQRERCDREERVAAKAAPRSAYGRLAKPTVRDADRRLRHTSKRVRVARAASDRRRLATQTQMSSVNKLSAVLYGFVGLADAPPRRWPSLCLI